MSQLQLIACHTIVAGKQDEVLRLLPQLAAAALTEPGCLAFEIYRHNRWCVEAADVWSRPELR